MEEKELELWQKIKAFLKDVNDENYSIGDAYEMLQCYYEELESLS